MIVVVVVVLLVVVVVVAHYLIVFVHVIVFVVCMCAYLVSAIQSEPSVELLKQLQAVLASESLSWVKDFIEGTNCNIQL